MTKQRNSFVGACFLLCFLLSGCVSYKAWKYQAEPKSELPQVSEKSIAVAPLIDKRGNENNDIRPLALVPLAPYGWQDFDVPEQAEWDVNPSLYWLLLGSNVFEHQNEVNSNIRRWRPAVDIVDFAARELRSANIFREVAPSPAGADLVLEGTLHSTNHHAKVMTYCISIISPVLWILGAPVVLVSNEIDVTLRIRDRSANRIIWHKNYRRRRRMASWIYFINTDFLFLEVVKEILLEATRDIRLYAKNH